MQVLKKTDGFGKWAPAAALASIAALSSAVYSNTFNAAFQLDDYLYVLEYNKVHALGSYWPPHGTRYLAYLSFALNYRAGGVDVFGYHLVNLLIHTLNGMLVYLLASFTLAAPRLKDERLPRFHIALLAALLFAAHPVQTEAVTYVSQRAASLATLFYLLSLVLYIRSRLSGGGRTGIALYAGSFASAVCAQMTKEIGFTLPFVILLYELAFFSGPMKGRILKLFPLLLTMLIIPYSLFGPEYGAHGVGDGIRELQLRDLHSISRHDYLVTQFRVMVTYLRLLVLPVNQTLEYDYPMFNSFFNPEVFTSFLFLLAIFVTAVCLFLRSLRKGNGYLALISMGVIWFFVTVSVESSVVPIKDIIFEHRLYLPSIGAAIAFSSCFFLISTHAKERAGLKLSCGALLAVGFLFTVAPLGAASYLRNGVWKDTVSLYEDALSKSPEKGRVRYNLAWAYHSKGEVDKALAQYLEDLRIEPDKDKAHYNAALIYQGKGEAGKAIYHFTEALRTDPSNPAACYNLALAYQGRGDMDRAIEYYEKAVKIMPGYEDAHFNLGWTYMAQGDLVKASMHFGNVLEINPGSADAAYNLKAIYERQGAQGVINGGSARR